MNQNKKSIVLLFFILCYSLSVVKCTDLDKNAWFFQLLFISFTKTYLIRGVYEIEMRTVSVTTVFLSRAAMPPVV